MSDTLKDAPAPDVPASPPPPPGIRWWPLPVILAMAALALLVIWSRSEVQFQDKFTQSVFAGLLSGILLGAWLLFFSRMHRMIRALFAAAGVALALLAGTLFEIRGVTGDLIPILGLRGQPKESQAVAGDPLPSEATDKAITVTPTTNDFPQFMGPFRDCTVRGPGLARDWVAQPPQELWRHPVGPAWSGFAVVGHVALTQEQRGGEERVIAYDVRTGAPLWSHADDAHYSTTIAGEGPRATPTVVDGRVYTMGATGILNCLDLATGRLLWKVNVVVQHHGSVLEWGMPGSPMVVSNLVVVVANGKGATLAAYERETGELAWTGGEVKASFSSPHLATIAGTPQILSLNANFLTAHDPAGGEVLWKHPWPGQYPKVALPVLLPDDNVLISSGYGVGSELLQVERNEAGRFAVRSRWKNIKLKAKFTNVIYKDGHIYGLDDGIMVCLDATTGAQLWKDGRYGHGQIILSGGLLVVMCEDGNVVLMEPAPDQLRELGRFTALTDKTWNPHALAGDLLLVRNHKEAACYRLPLVK